MYASRDFIKKIMEQTTAIEDIIVELAEPQQQVSVEELKDIHANLMKSLKEFEKTCSTHLAAYEKATEGWDELPRYLLRHCLTFV